jgi:hypothetical protein
VEEVSFKLAGLACLSAAGLLLACWRGIATWLATRRLLRNWLQNAEPLPPKTFALPPIAYAIPFPVVALWALGVRVCSLLKSCWLNSIRRSWTAALAHEAGHLAARDNGKRALLRACRDVLTLVPCGRALDRAWDAAAKRRGRIRGAQRPSDRVESGVGAGQDRAPRAAQMKPATPVSVSFIDADAGVLTRRVQRLMQMAEAS